MSNRSTILWLPGDARFAIRNSRLFALVLVFLSFAISFAFLAPTLNSKIALMDESDISQYLGTQNRTEPSQIFRIVSEKTEVGEFGKSQRFRPFFFTLRVTETALWGDDGSYWYAFRIFLFGIVIAGFWWIYSRLVGIALGTVFLAYTLSFRMWGDVWARSTGVSEQYAAVGFVLFAIGALLFIEAWRQDGRSLRKSSLFLALGAIVAMGSKENMLILEVPLAVAVALGLLYRRLDFIGLLLLSAGLAMGLWVASSIVVYFYNSKIQDIYGNSIGRNLLTSKWVVIVSCASVLSLVVAYATRKMISYRYGTEKAGAYDLISRRYFFWFFCIVAFFAFQYLFYSGQAPAGGRYDFPLILALPAFFILLFLSLSESAELFFKSSQARNTLAVFLAVGLLVYVVRTNWTLPAAVAANVERTNNFFESLKKTQRRADQNPDWPVIVLSYNPWDYEVVQAFGEFFVQKKMRNPRFLIRITNFYEQPRTEFEKNVLDAHLEKQSRDGDVARRYLPIGSYKKYSTQGCFVIALRQPARFVSDGDLIPSVARNCERLPMNVYWDKNAIVFGAPLN